MSATLLVAHHDEGERHRLAAALHDAGYEVLHASDGEQAMRSTAGLGPDLVIASRTLDRVPGDELRPRLAVTGLKLPPFLVVPDGGPGPTEDQEGVYWLDPGVTSPAQIVGRVRLILVAEAVSGEFSSAQDAVHGDLTRVALGDLMQALQHHVTSGRLVFHLTHEAGAWVSDGLVVDSWWRSLRGRKAFHRLAALPAGAFSFTLAEFQGERTIELGTPALIAEAAASQQAVDAALATLPSLDAKPEVRLGPSFFSMQFSPVERQVLAAAKRLGSLHELLDEVSEVDSEVLAAVTRLSELGVLGLTEPTGRIHLVTDSTADLLPSDARALGATVMGVSIVFGSEVFKDGVDLRPDDFVRRLQQTGATPTTSPVTPGEFLELFRRQILTGDILAVLCSSRLSGSHANAATAATDGLAELAQLRREAGISAEPTVLVVDSGQCSGALGLLVTFAARLIRRGRPLTEIATRVADIGRRMRTLLLVQSMPWIEQRQAVLAVGKAPSRSARPLLIVRDGGLELAEWVTAGSAGAGRMVSLLTDGIEPGRPVFAAVVHASAPALAAELRDQLMHALTVTELAGHQIGPAVTCNAGPGALGACVFEPTADELELLGA